MENRNAIVLLGAILVGFVIAWIRRGQVEIERVEVITYEEIVEFLSQSTHQPPAFKQAAIMRSSRPSGIEIRIVYLNEFDKPIQNEGGVNYGRTLLAQRLDKELLEAFGDKNVILVQ